MRNFINLFLFAAVVAFGYILIEQQFFPCYGPLTYEIGKVDPQFDVSHEELITLAQEAERIWEDKVERDLFTYTEESGVIKISLVFDERQRDTLDARHFAEQLDSQEQELKSIEDRYEALTQEYRAAEESFLEQVENYEARRERFEERVDEWNKSDRSDEEELRSLQAEQETLDEMQETLLEKEEALETQNEELERVLAERNELASEYNENVQTYNERFGNRGTFDQGQYSSSDTEITIYQFENKTDLTLALTHELGHALGIGHVEDPSAIMYYLMRDQQTDPISPTKEDITALEQTCKF